MTTWHTEETYTDTGGKCQIIVDEKGEEIINENGVTDEKFLSLILATPEMFALLEYIGDLIGKKWIVGTEAFPGHGLNIDAIHRMTTETIRKAKGE